jgi:hypothetical protein
MSMKKMAKMNQQAVDRWNANSPVGSQVSVTLDNGSVVATKTRSEAQLMGGHTPVVWLDGISGAYLLDRVTAA